jgi:hypothetical protein
MFYANMDMNTPTDSDMGVDVGTEMGIGHGDRHEHF